ncbi:putative bifunctional diguanylate cyclase/phosphodiesterase [Rhizocola hellebori]|uniref:putative bifunctional diguanylate cyclase/phosphodiesterase n=1 Tax=Rhizocola hellebori TaxID=1392758 RepID=UPI001EF3468F|nr:EAL domain-containing protein [Rhizocola hellebori]
MVALTLRATRSSRPPWMAIYSGLVGLVAVVMFIATAEQIPHTVSLPAFWLMTGLALVAAALAFVTTDIRGASVVLCPVLCFSFATVLCWGLAPAILMQTLATAVVGLRLRDSAKHIGFIAAQYAVAFTAAYVVVQIGDPKPFATTTVVERLSDTATVILAAAAFLAVFLAQTIITARLTSPGFQWQKVRASLAHQALFLASLLLLSPVLAVAAHVNVFFVLLIILPLYAVQKMARLSAERDRAAWADPLTGLANRRGLQARFDDLRAGKPMALLMLDLDRFKHVNDALGHDVGDRLLVAIAQRLTRQTPAGGTVGRLGGDEFAILVPGVRDAEEAHEVARTVLAALAQPVRLDELDIDVTASAGVAVHPDQGTDFATLMRHADVALYEAKRRGDSAASYDPCVDLNSPQRLGLLADFRRALESPGDEIALHYQPQVALDSGELVGVEALLRWTHPTRGLISTPEVLQVAEHTSVMHLLTVRVIDDVVAQLAAWRAQNLRLRVSINISARDLYSGEVVEHLATRLREYDVPPDQIQVEITESALMGDPVRAYSTVMKIVGIGVAVSLDDFGTGYSSLQHLRKLPLAEIKVDRSFVAGMADNSDDAAIVRSTVELAASLGLRSVAEGVENEYTWGMLAQTHCSLAQGWSVARPMPGAELARWHTNRLHARASQAQLTL